MSRYTPWMLILLLIPSSLLYWNSGKESAYERHVGEVSAAPRQAVQPVLDLAATPAAVAVAQPVPAAPSRRAARVVTMKVTAYCLCGICCEKWASLPDRVTSTGDNARIYDGVAADPKRLPYRTKLDIPGVGIREVDDTGGGMRKSAREGVTHIDVRMASHSEARRWGVKTLNVSILQ